MSHERDSQTGPGLHSQSDLPSYCRCVILSADAHTWSQVEVESGAENWQDSDSLFCGCVIGDHCWDVRIWHRWSEHKRRECSNTRSTSKTGNNLASCHHRSCRKIRSELWFCSWWAWWGVDVLKLATLSKRTQKHTYRQRTKWLLELWLNEESLAFVVLVGQENIGRRHFHILYSCYYTFNLTI